jgi:hypothetical protein
MAFTNFSQVEGLFNTHFNSTDWQPLINFAALRPVDASARVTAG